MGCGGVLVTYKATEQPAAVKSRTVDGCCWMGVEVIATGKKVVGLIEPIARSGHYTDLYTHTDTTTLHGYATTGCTHLQDRGGF